MKLKTDENIFLTITLYLILISASDILIDPTLFNKPALQNKLAIWYSLSLLFLITYYILEQFNIEKLLNQKATDLLGLYIILNLFYTTLLILFLAITKSYKHTYITYLIGAIPSLIKINLLIPVMLTLGTLAVSVTIHFQTIKQYITKKLMKMKF